MMNTKNKILFSAISSDNKNHSKNELIANNSVSKNFRISKFTVYKNKKYVVDFSEGVNILTDKSLEDFPISLGDTVKLIKFSLTGKNEMKGHLHDSGISYIATEFFHNNEKYRIKIFTDHIYRSFLTKEFTIKNKTNIRSEEIIADCRGLKDFHSKIEPFLKKMFGLPDQITIPQYFRLFLMFDEDSMLRIISEKQYERMTTQMLNFIIDKIMNKVESAPELISRLNTTKGDIFNTYSEKTIIDKIQRLNKIQDMEINETKTGCDMEINKLLSEKVNIAHKQIILTEREIAKVVLKIKQIKKEMKHKKQDENQMRLFDKDDFRGHTEIEIHEKLKNNEDKLNRLTLNLDYLNTTICEYEKEKKFIKSKYLKLINEIIADYQDKILQEEINLEELRDQKTKDENYLINNISIGEVKELITSLLERKINTYLDVIFNNVDVKFSKNYIPLFSKNDQSYREIEIFDKTTKILLALCFHLGLSDFFGEFNGIFPPILLMNFPILEIGTIKKINKAISIFKNNKNNYQLIVLYSKTQKSIKSEYLY